MTDGMAEPRVRTRVEARRRLPHARQPAGQRPHHPGDGRGGRRLGVAGGDAAVEVIVVEAAGTRAFSAGVDVADHTPEKMDHMLRVFNDLCLGLHRSPKPTVAAVRRMALGGGCELAAFCDLIVASDKATFGQPEIKVGVYPVLGAALFAQMVGPKAAERDPADGWHLRRRGGDGLSAWSTRCGRTSASTRSWPRTWLVLTANSGLVMSLTKKAILASAGKDPEAAAGGGGARSTSMSS